MDTATREERKERLRQDLLGGQPPAFVVDALRLSAKQAGQTPSEFAGLPGYVWDSRMAGGRYRRLLPDGRLGRLVSREVVIDELRDATERVADTFVNLGRALGEGRITPAQFERAMQITAKHAHLANGALAAGGWDQMGAADFGRVGGRLRFEYRRIGEFARAAQEALDAGEALDPDALAARAGLYDNSAYSTYYRVRRAREEFSESRLITVGDDNVCPICEEIEAREWVAIGSYPPPGTIHPGCRCTEELR